jgi:hypothetical protein
VRANTDRNFTRGGQRLTAKQIANIIVRGLLWAALGYGIGWLLLGPTSPGAFGGAIGGFFGGSHLAWRAVQKNRSIAPRDQQT